MKGFSQLALYVHNLALIYCTNPFSLSGVKDSPQLALYVHNTALRELRWTSLREIQRGRVAFIDNNELCYEETINWDDILVQGTFEV